MRRVNLRAVNQSQYFDTAKALGSVRLPCVDLHLVIFSVDVSRTRGIQLTRERERERDSNMIHPSHL